MPGIELDWESPEPRFPDEHPYNARYLDVPEEIRVYAVSGEELHIRGEDYYSGIPLPSIRQVIGLPEFLEHVGTSFLGDVPDDLVGEVDFDVDVEN